ncbi:MAG: hypothetical protein DMF68_09770 [Acidobacteria bacterium]|nr:MAG: hypothetical protein DMF68_09770 [Acidobacteriota bacterium]
MIGSIQQIVFHSSHGGGAFDENAPLLICPPTLETKLTQKRFVSLSSGNLTAETFAKLCFDEMVNVSSIIP